MLRKDLPKQIAREMDLLQSRSGFVRAVPLSWLSD